MSVTKLSGCSLDSCRNTIWSINVKMAVFAPIPNASDRMAIAANTGLRRRTRSAYRTSASKFVMVVNTATEGEGYIGMGGGMDKIVKGPAGRVDCASLQAMNPTMKTSAKPLGKWFAQTVRRVRD